MAQSLSRVIFEGPEAELTLTANAQPALMAVSLAAVRVLENEAGLDLSRDAKFVAGHSLGEYSALCAAGALSLADTARLAASARLGDAGRGSRGRRRDGGAAWRRARRGARNRGGGGGRDRRRVPGGQ